MRFRQALKGEFIAGIGKSHRDFLANSGKFYAKQAVFILVKRMADNIGCRLTCGKIERKAPLIVNVQRGHLFCKPCSQR